MILLYIAVLGGVGFLCGFVGPMILAPEANQGPLAGIFITGPLGALLGAALGAVGRSLGWSPPIRAKVLLWTSAAMAVTVLVLCVPSPHRVADLVDGEIRGCVDPRTLRESTVARLNGIEARRADARAKNWEVEFDTAMAQRPGMVLQIHVLRTRPILEKQAVWNRGELAAGSWTAADTDKRFFVEAADATCSGARAQFSVTGLTQIWRPSGIAEILDLQVAQLAAQRYPGFVADR